MVELSYVAQKARRHTWQCHLGNRADRMVVCGHSSWICLLVFKIGSNRFNATSSPATSLLDSKSHLEKPIKYMKLPAK